MSFLNPWALLGFLTLPVIVWMHLHLERNRRVVVSSMFLWSFLDEKFQGKTPKYVRISWLLMLDLLIAAFFSMALARPMLKVPAAGGGPVEQIVLLDTSVSMLAQDGEPDRFSLAQELVASIVEESSRNDVVSVIAVGSEVEMIGSTDEMGARDLIGKVRDLSPTGIGVDLRSALAAAQQYADPELPSEIYMITDAAFELPQVADYPLEIRWVFIGFEDTNQAVIDPQIGKEQGGQRELFFRVANYSDVQVVRELQIMADGERVFTKQVTLAAKTILPQLVDLSGEIKSVEIALTGTDMVPGDDSVIIGATQSSEVDVAVVAADPFPIDRAISSIPGTMLTTYTLEEYDSDLDFDLVIFRGMVPDSWPKGTVLVFDPPPENSVVPVLPTEQVDAVTAVKPSNILEGVDLTGVRWGLAYRIEPPAGFEVLASAGNLPILLHEQIEGSEIYLFAPLLVEGNFTRHPAFPILLANMAANSGAVAVQPAYHFGSKLDLDQMGISTDLVITLPDGEEIDAFEGPVIPLASPGQYQLSWRDKFGEQKNAVFGVNQGDLEESDIHPRGWRNEYISEDSEIGPGFQMIEVPLAPWLLFLAVVLLVVEAWRAWR